MNIYIRSLAHTPTFVLTACTVRLQSDVRRTSHLSRHVALKDLNKIQEKNKTDSSHIYEYYVEIVPLRKWPGLRKKCVEFWLMDLTDDKLDVTSSAVV